MNSQEAHFTNEDRQTLVMLSQSSAVLESKLDRVIKDVSDLTNNFAEKTELADVERRVDNIESNLSKAVWIVLSIVILAILSLVVISYK